MAHPLKNMVPLEPLRIDPPAGYFYMPNTSPSARPAIAVQSPSPQPRVVHPTSSLVSITLLFVVGVLDGFFFRFLKYRFFGGWMGEVGKKREGFNF